MRITPHRNVSAVVLIVLSMSSTSNSAAPSGAGAILSRTAFIEPGHVTKKCTFPWHQGLSFARVPFPPSSLISPKRLPPRRLLQLPGVKKETDQLDQTHVGRKHGELHAILNKPPPANFDAFEGEKLERDEDGSVLGAALLFAGTAVGAGMLALPAETAPAGFVPSITSLVLCWMFTFVTSLVTLEASWMADQKKLATSRDKSAEGNEASGGGFLSIGRTALGSAGEVATAVLFWFLLTSIIIAYTSEGGTIMSDFASEQFGASLDTRVCSAAFMTIFATLAILGTDRVDLVNRFLVAGLIGSFLGLVGIGLPMIDPVLLYRADWNVIYPPVISVGILSFGAQNVVPTLLHYLGGDAKRTRKAVLIGSLIPLIMYAFWEAVFLGVIPWDPDAGGSKMQVVSSLGATGGTVVKELVEAFSACSIGSSMAGASVSLVDFFQDAISSRGGKAESTGTKQGLGARLGAATFALGPPLGLACAYPDAFLGALENAGLIGGVSLYGLLPALAVVKLRQKEDILTMPGRLIGGVAALYLIAAASIVLVLPEFVRLGAGSLA